MLDRVGIGVSIVPPFTPVAGKSVFYHNLFQIGCVSGGYFCAVAEIPVSHFREVIKAGGHLQFGAILIYQGDIHGVAPAVGAEAIVGIGHIGGIGADLPKPELGSNRTEAIPNFYTIPGFLYGLLNLHQLLYRAVPKIGLGELIDDLSGKIIFRSIPQIDHSIGNEICDAYKILVRKF